MRFNGTTVPTHRDDTYTTTETNRDIQTGRAVYADKDKYENDADYKASIDSYVKEGFHLIFGTPDNPSEGGGGGGAEPLIVNKVNTGTDLDPVMTLDHTFQEIFDAYMLGKAVLITEGGYDTELVYRTSGGELGYSLYTRNFTYVANEPNEYPVEN